MQSTEDSRPKEITLYFDYIATLVALDLEREKDQVDFQRAEGLMLKSQADRAELEFELRKMQIMPKEDADRLIKGVEPSLVELATEVLVSMRQDQLDAGDCYEGAHPAIKARADHQVIEKSTEKLARRIDELEEKTLAELRQQIEQAARSSSASHSASSISPSCAKVAASHMCGLWALGLRAIAFFKTSAASSYLPRVK